MFLKLAIRNIFRFSLHVFTVLGLGCGCLLSVPQTAAASAEGDAIVKQADDCMDLGDYTCDMIMTVRRTGEDDRLYKMKVQASGSTNMLIDFVFPPRDKGQAYLRVGDDMWLYLPSVNRTMRIPGREAFAGGDFNNQDVLSVRLQKDYAAERLKDEIVEDTDCYCLKLSAHNTSAPYAAILYWVNKQNYWPVKRVFFTVGGQAFKTLIIRSKSGSRPDSFVMSNIMEKDKTTEMEWTNIRQKQIDAKIFTENYLIRRR
jgi:outer membrane lipoprotein-sorting protein